MDLCVSQPLGLTCIALLCLAVNASAGALEERLPEPLRGVKRVVTLGDSITQGGGEPGGYVWLIQKALQALYPRAGIEVINAGISGHKSPDMHDRFQRDVLDKKPQLVTISVGINDVWHGFTPDHPEGGGPNGVPLDQFRQRVRQMVQAAWASHVRVAVLSTTVIGEDPDTPTNRMLEGYNEALEQVAREFGSLYIDLNAPFHQAIGEHRRATGDRGNWLTVDGVHMNPRGNRLMAREILRGLGVSGRDLDRVLDLLGGPQP